jgi:hypothetical protein
MDGNEEYSKFEEIDAGGGIYDNYQSVLRFHTDSK